MRDIVRAIWRKPTACAFLVLFALPLLGQAQVSKRTLHSTRRISSPASTPQTTLPKYKGIWEPISYPDDIQLFDVFFATAEEGWAAGGTSAVRGGIIIHTTDGGNHWEVQYGDPQSSDGGILDMRFLDSNHGWATQYTGSEARLLRTTDGKNWLLAGTLDEHHEDYMFTSERNGIQLSGNAIELTGDGGRNWKEVFHCGAKIQVNGLWQNVSCEWQRLQFLTSRVGYAVANSGDANKMLFLAKTKDGGATWSMTTAEVSGEPEDAFFIDENTGYIRTGYQDSGQVFKTTDGGQTWAGMAASPGKRIQFADPEVGWAVSFRRVSFTTNGGNRWNSREYAFPASVNAFNLPRRDRGYVVGDHGMIYRYRVVPADYRVPNMIEAPAMPGMDTSQLTAAASRVQQDIQGLQAQIASASGGQTASGNVPSNVAPAPSSQQPPAANDSSASDSLSQNVDASAVSSPEASTAGSFDTATGVGGDFIQNVDTSPASAPLQDCCGSALQNLQGDLTSFNQAVPPATTQFRPLNLVIAGLQVVTNLLTQAHQLRTAFSTLKHAPSLQAASLALQQLSTAITSTQQTVTTGFQNPGAYFAANPPAGFTQNPNVIGPAGTSSAYPGNAPVAAGSSESFTSEAASPATPVDSGAANASILPQGTPFALLPGAGNSALAPASAQVVTVNTKTQDLNTLAADDAVLQAFQQVATGVAQQEVSSLSSSAASSLSGAAGAMVGGLFSRRKPAVVYLWGIPSGVNGISVNSSNPTLEVNFASVPGVNPNDYAPAIVRLVLARNGWLLVGAAKGQAGALQSSSTDWRLYSSFAEERVPARVTSLTSGLVRIQPAQSLAPGAYAVVLRPVSRNKTFSGADVAGLQGDGLVFNSLWKFVVNSGASTQ